MKICCCDDVSARDRHHKGQHGDAETEGGGGEGKG